MPMVYNFLVACISNLVMDGLESALQIFEHTKLYLIPTTYFLFLTSRTDSVSDSVSNTNGAYMIHTTRLFVTQ